MAKLYVGKNNEIPVKNLVSQHWGDIVGELENQTDLQEALDSKLNKTENPLSLYGTDVNGNSTTYDASILFSEDSIPQEYTKVEYISSGDESIKSVRIRDYHAETSSFMGFEIVDAGRFMDYFNNVLARRYNYPITCVKFQVENPSISGAPMLWFIYVNAQGSTEPTMRNGGSVYEEPYDGLDGIEHRWGIRPIYSDTASREEGDSGTFDIYEVRATGQYIDTGIEVNNYPYGYGVIDKERSEYANPGLYPTVSDSYYRVFSELRQSMANSYGIAVHGIKVVCLVNGSSYSYEIYPDPQDYETDTPYRTYNNANTLYNNTGIYLVESQVTNGDTLYANCYDAVTESIEIQTSVKANNAYINDESYSVQFLGAKERSGQAGVQIATAYNDGVVFKHYIVYASAGRDIPYQNGVFNDIVLGMSEMTVNGVTYALSESQDKIRTPFGKSIILFGSQNEVGITPDSCSMKTTIIKKNGEEVFHGVPCIENASGKAGMYDIVSSTFLPSAKEGADFIAGPISTSNKMTLGLEGTNALIGLGRDGSLQTYTGKNGVIVDAVLNLDDYEQLEYIESTDGNLSFDTGLKLKDYVHSADILNCFEVTYALGATTSGQAGAYSVFGIQTFNDIGQSYHRYNFNFFSGNSRFEYNHGTTNGSFLPEDLGIFHTATFTYNRIYLDGKQVATINPRVSQEASDKSIRLFAPVNAYQTGDYGKGIIGKISGFKRYNNATSDGRLSSDRIAVADFVPVRRKSDGMLGFYDKINGVFAQNSIADGNPIAGPTATNKVTLSRNLNNLLENKAGESAIEKRNMIVSDTELDDARSDLSQPHNTVLGINAHSKGSYNTVIGADAGSSQSKVENVVVGNGAYAYDSYSVAIGDTARTEKANSIAVGQGAHTTGVNSVAIGNSTYATGNNSIAIGIKGGSNDSYKPGQDTIVIGYQAKSSQATGATLIGTQLFTNSGPTYSVGIGHSSQVIGGYNVAVGYGATAQSESIAIGSKTYVGQGGIAIGSKNGTDSGDGARAGEYSVAIGQTSKVLSNYSVALGYGAHDTSNSLNYSVGIGYNATIDSSWSVALGDESKTEGSYGVAIGSGAKVLRNTDDPSLYSVAIGSEATASRSNAIALGYQTSASGYNVAIGQYARATNNNEVAIGSGANTFGSGGIAIGESASASNRSVAIGNSTQANNDTQATALGANAVASGQNSVALGVYAVASASEAIQLGEGTNGEASTLQFRGYKLVDSDGHIPTQRLSSMTPENGYVLAYDADTESLVWVENGEGGGSYVLPTATATRLGGIKVGSGLSITEDGVLSTIGGSGEGGNGVWGEIIGTLSDQTDLKNALDEKQEIFQVQSLPTASAELNGKVRQYMGITNIMYTHGYMYECQYKKVPTFTIDEQDMQAHISLNAERFKQYMLVYQDVEVPTSQIEVRFDGTDWLVTNMGSGDSYGSYSLYNLQYLGISIEYEGSASPEVDDYVILNYNAEGEFRYTWTNITTQPLVSVIDNVTSDSTSDALSAKQGKVLNERIDTLASIGQFLAIWDCNKNGHNARYLADGYQYSIGNYFIVGAVEEWNIDPEEGPVTVSFETNNHVAVSGGYTTTGDETKLYNRYKPTTDATFKFTWNVSSQKWYDETKHTYLNAGSLLSTIGFCPSYPSASGEVQAADLVEGDYFEVIYTHTHNYFPVGDTYYEAPNAGCVRTYEDIQVSDMIFYDGQNWVLLANHSKQTAVDHDLDPTSKNPVENATITNALNNKVSTTSDGNRVYGTTALGEQVALELGENLTITGGVIDAVPTDISGKQDTLVSGENIKTINGESILGSGNITIEGGSGGEGIGTLNVANAFITSADIIPDENHPYNYKGGYSHIMVTTNGDKDYLLDHMHDFYITTMRRKKLNGVRKFRSLNDHRVPTNIHLHCWRVPTYKYWDYDLRQFSEYPLDQRTSDQMSDADYVYFYTTSDYNSVEDLISSDPNVLVSDLRRDGETKTQEENVTQGNWGTCLNLMNNIGRKENTLNVRYFVKSYNSDIERCARYDIDKIVNLKNNELDESIRYYDDTEVFKKMRGRLYKDTNGDKVYLWSNGWEKTNNPVFACLGENDEPVVNYVPLDKRDITQWCTYNQFVAMGWELVEKRVDLDWLYFDYNLGYGSYDVLLNIRRISTMKNGVDGDSDFYLLDNSIQPVSLAECKIYMKELPYVYVESGGENPYEQYWQRAYTWYEIKDNPNLMYMLDKQKEIIFVLPHDTYTFWMRTFRWERYVYHHMQQSAIMVGEEEVALNTPTVEQISREDGTYYYEWDGGYTTQPLVAHPTERHNLMAGIETTYARRDKNFKNQYSPDVFWGGFENDLARRLGDKHKSFHWNMENDISMWLPIAFSVATGHEVGMDCIGKETPVERTMTINGRGYQGLI